MPGTTSTTNGSNGVSFARASDIDASRLLDQAFQARIGTVVISSATNSTTRKVGVVSVTPRGSIDDFDARVNGELLRFRGGVAFGADGTIYNSFANQQQWSAAVEIYDDNFAPEVLGVAIMGLETNPANLTNNPIARYDGTFVLIASINDPVFGPEAFLQLGDIVLNANFGTGSISGTLIPDLDDNYTFSGDIEGNGFSADLDFCATIPTASCTQQGSVIDGIFYGPDGEEVGGLIEVQASVSDPAGTTTIDAVGGFLAAR